MSKKRYIILSIVLVSLLIAAIFMLIRDKEEVKENVTLMSHQISQQTYALIEKCTDKKPIESKELDLLEETNQNNNHHLLTVLNLWYELKVNNEEDISVRLDPRVKGAKKIGFNSRILAALKTDDKIQLPLIHNKKYLLNIKGIKKTSNNKLEIYGELNHDGKMYASTLSITKKSLYGLLSTPTGNFDIRMSNDKGYIYPSNQLVDIDGSESPSAIVDLPPFL